MAQNDTNRENRRNSFDKLVNIYLLYVFLFYGLFPCDTVSWIRVKDVDDLVRASSVLENQFKINFLLIADHGDNIQIWDRAVLSYEPG